MADFPWDTSNMDQTQKKMFLRPPTQTHVLNRNMLENTIFYLIRDDYIYNIYIYMFIQQYLYSNMYQTRQVSLPHQPCEPQNPTANRQARSAARLHVAQVDHVR